MKNPLKNKFVRLVLLLVWFGVMTGFVSYLYPSFITSETAICAKNINRTVFYQWILDEQRCLLRVDQLIVVYFYLLILYAIYHFVRQRIVGHISAIRWQGLEFLAWFLLGWGALIGKTITVYQTITGFLLYASFFGMLIFFLPLVLVVGLMSCPMKHKMIGYIRYLCWYGFMTGIMAVVFSCLMGTNAHGEMCRPITGVVGAFYQGIWNGQPCLFTSRFYIALYVYWLVLYGIYSVFRNRIIGHVVSIKGQLVEFGIWFLIYWCYLIVSTKNASDSMTVSLIGTSFLGTLIFFLPFVLVVCGLFFFRQKKRAGEN